MADPARIVTSIRAAEGWRDDRPVPLAQRRARLLEEARRTPVLDAELELVEDEPAPVRNLPLEMALVAAFAVALAVAVVLA